jgi:uncharacterized protein YdhG (YjbR/CyaY superfamily)
METFNEFLAGISNPRHRARTTEVLDWVADRYPGLATRVAWNQPMFTDHGTFIIAFSVAGRHLAVSPEQVVIERFADDITAAGYEYTKMLIRIPWDKPVDYALLEKLIEFNIRDKAESTSFWRK